MTTKKLHSTRANNKFAKPKTSFRDTVKRLGLGTKEERLSELQKLQFAHVALMGYDDPKINQKIEYTEKNYDALVAKMKALHRKFAELMSMSDTELRIRITNSPHHVKEYQKVDFAEDECYSRVSDKTIRKKIKQRTLTEDEYFNAVFPPVPWKRKAVQSVAEEQKPVPVKKQAVLLSVEEGFETISEGLLVSGEENIEYLGGLQTIYKEMLGTESPDIENRMIDVATSLESKIEKLAEMKARYDALMSVSDVRFRINNSNERNPLAGEEQPSLRAIKSRIENRALTESEYYAATSLLRDQTAVTEICVKTHTESRVRFFSNLLRSVKRSWEDLCDALSGRGRWDDGVEGFLGLVTGSLATIFTAPVAAVAYTVSYIKDPNHDNHNEPSQRFNLARRTQY